MNLFKNISVKRKLFYIVFSIFVLIIIVTASFAFISFVISSEKITQNNSKLINDYFAEQITNEINKSILLTEVISSSLTIDNEHNNYIVKKNQESLMYRLIYENEMITDIFLVLNSPVKNVQNIDTLNNYKFSLHKSKEGILEKIYDERNYSVNISRLKKLKEGQELIVSEPFLLKFSKESKFVISLVSPVYRNESLIGSFGINYSIENISNILNRSISLSTEAKSILLSKNNMIVSVTGKERLTGKNIHNIEGKEHDLYMNIISNSSISSFGDFAVNFQTITIENADLEWQIISTLPYNSVFSFFSRNIYNMIIIISIIMLAGLLLLVYFLRRSFSPLSSIIQAITKINSGEPVKLTVENSDNEFAELIYGINNISDKLNGLSEVTSEIASGNYKRKLEIVSDNDILSTSVNRIADNMKTTFEENILQEQNTYQQLWKRRGRFEVSEAERKSKNNIYDLTFNIIRSIVNYTEAVLGGIYLYDEDINKISLYAAYAYGKRKQLQNEFKPGEGLVGACVVEKKKIVLSKIPENYIKISSGLGSGTPGYLVLLPILFQDKINSVIEIAFIKKADDYIIEFIEQLGDNIGAWIDASLINTKTANLLSVSREQTKELAEKENELNIKVEELQNIQAEIAVQNAEYKSILNAVNNTVMKVEYTLDGIVEDSNDIYEKIMGFSIDDIKGLNVFDLVKDQKEDLKKIIDEVRKGIPVKRQVKRYTKNGKEKWLLATYTPYYDKDENITRVLFFAFDITEMKTELENIK